MKLIREIDGIVILEGVTKHEKDVEASLELTIEDWKLLVKKIAILEKILKPLKEQVSVIEEALIPVAQEMEEQRRVINSAIITIKESSKSTIKYKEVVTKALEIATADQKSVLNETINKLTTKSVSTKLNILEPEIADFLVTLNQHVTADELLERLGDIDKLPRNIINKKKREGKIAEGLSDKLPSIAKIFSDVKNILSFAFKSVYKKLEKSKKSADKLAQVAQEK